MRMCGLDNEDLLQFPSVPRWRHLVVFVVVVVILFFSLRHTEELYSIYPLVLGLARCSFLTKPGVKLRDADLCSSA